MLIPVDGVQNPTFFTFSWCNFNRSSLMFDRLPSSKFTFPVSPSISTWIVWKKRRKKQFYIRTHNYFWKTQKTLSINRIRTALSLSYNNVPFGQRFDNLHEILAESIGLDDPSNDPTLWANTLTASYINAGSACKTRYDISC